MTRGIGRSGASAAGTDAARAAIAHRAAAAAGDKAGKQRLTASFALYNYRLFFTGALISNIGTWMARVAQDWLVLTQLTNRSSSALGLVTGLQFLPVALLAPYGGAIADRFSKRSILMITQAALGLNAAVLWALVATGEARLWHVYVLAVLQGIATAFDNPSRQAFVSEMVPAKLIPNAVGLNSASFNGARLLGPGVAGLIIGAWGIAPALLINAISFAAVIADLWLMRTSELTPGPIRRGKGAVREGVAYVRKRSDIILVLVIVFMLGTFGMNFQITNALMATRVYGKGAEEYGLLGSIMAIGTLGAALMAARRGRPKLRTMLGALAGFAVSTTALALAPTYTVFAILLVPTGLFALTVMTTANSSVQLAAAPEVRGRVMALYMAIFMGGTPLGAPFVGWIGDVLGPRWTILVGSIATGATFLAVAAYLLWRRPVMLDDRV